MDTHVGLFTYVSLCTSGVVKIVRIRGAWILAPALLLSWYVTLGKSLSVRPCAAWQVHDCQQQGQELLR